MLSKLQGALNGVGKKVIKSRGPFVIIRLNPPVMAPPPGRQRMPIGGQTWTSQLICARLVRLAIRTLLSVAVTKKGCSNEGSAMLIGVALALLNAGKKVLTTVCLFCAVQAKGTRAPPTLLHWDGLQSERRCGPTINQPSVGTPVFSGQHIIPKCECK